MKYAQRGALIAAFLGQPDDEQLVRLAGEHVDVIAAMAKAYTRGRGFDPNSGEPTDDIAAVIVAATARMVANPEQIAYTAGTVTMQGGFQGWSLAELAVLNRYRKRAQ